MFLPHTSRNPVHHKRTKHIELDIHFVREKVSVGDVRILHIPSTRQLVDIFTKGLPTTLFEEFRSNLCIPVPNTEIEGGVIAEAMPLPTASARRATPRALHMTRPPHERMQRRTRLP